MMADPLENESVDFKIDPTTGDLVIEGGQLQLSSGLEAVAQGIRLRFLAFQGEWFLDLENGVPYWQDILGQKYDQARVLQIFRQPLLATPGVARVISLTSEWDGTTRTLNVSWEVETSWGDTVEDSLPITA
jgi:hypothetical protein